MPATNRSGRLLLWLATVGAVLFAAFPYYSGTVAEVLLSGASPTIASNSPRLAHASFVIQGMDCAACASAVENNLKALHSVRSVTDSIESQKADIDYDPRFTTLSPLESAISLTK